MFNIKNLFRKYQVGEGEFIDTIPRHYKIGVKYILRQYYYKTAYEWLHDSNPRKVVDNPQGIVKCAMLSDFCFGNYACYFYPITDTEPCSKEEAIRLLKDYNSSKVKDYGWVWWRSLTEQENTPQELEWEDIAEKLNVRKEKYMERNDFLDICVLIVGLAVLARLFLMLMKMYQ